MKPLIVLIALLCLLGCADSEQPLTEDEIEALIDARVAEELAKMNADVLTAQDIAEIAVKSTVYLSVKTTNGASTGSGFFITKDTIATNYHVVAGIISGTVSPAFDHDWYSITKVIAIDKPRDLAVLRVADIVMPPLVLADSDPIWNGATVYVIGNPLNQKGTFSSGIVSAVRPMENNPTDRMFQITAPVSRGSSGGPVLNEKAEVIGIVKSQFSIGQNLNFAIPSNYLKSLLATIR